MSELIQPDWPAPLRVRAFATTRRGGVSTGPFADFNLGDHVGDDPAAVIENRRRLRELGGLPGEPAWLEQVHGAEVVHVAPGIRQRRMGDGAVATVPGAICTVLTADCLPVLFTSRQGTVVAAAHAGWRGLAAGILEAVIGRMGQEPADLMAWIGPGIGPNAFEVGPEVRQQLLVSQPASADFFVAGRGDRWLADLPGLARHRLRQAGVMQVYGGDRCTFTEHETFFSHRRDGPCGRMAALIWIAGSPDR